MARRGSTEKGREEGSAGSVLQESQSIACGQVLIYSEPQFLLFLGRSKGCFFLRFVFFFFLIIFLPIPSLKCNKSLTWMLGKIRVDQRVGRQAARQGNNHLMFCFDFCFKSRNDRSHSSAVCLEIYLKGICDCF